jgi:hypothetical protein
MLYLKAGTPAIAQASIILWMSSMSRSRSGLLASMIAGRWSRSMCDDVRNGRATVFRVTPLASANSRVCSTSDGSQ